MLSISLVRIARKNKLQKTIIFRSSRWAGKLCAMKFYDAPFAFRLFLFLFFFRHIFFSAQNVSTHTCDHWFTSADEDVIQSQIKKKMRNKGSNNWAIVELMLSVQLFFCCLKTCFIVSRLFFFFSFFSIFILYVSFWSTALSGNMNTFSIRLMIRTRTGNFNCGRNVHVLNSGSYASHNTRRSMRTIETWANIKQNEQNFKANRKYRNKLNDGCAAMRMKIKKKKWKKNTEDSPNAS